MKAQLMIGCLGDALFGSASIASARILEHAGVKVSFHENQTCCGQPACNAGDFSSSNRVLNHWKGTFLPGIPIVTPSGSCAAFLQHGIAVMGASLDGREVLELSEFLVKHDLLDRVACSLHPSREVVWHGGCHARTAGIEPNILAVLSQVSGLKVTLPMANEQCCGFGGAFCATEATLTERIGLAKLNSIIQTGCKTVISGDAGCLMHLEGLSRRQGIPVTFKHYAELIWEAIA